MSRKMINRSTTLLAILTLLGSSLFAAETNEGRSITGFFKKLFNYPVKATKETAQMTGNTLQNTGEKVIAKTGENASEVLKGDLTQTPAIVTDAVVGAAETVGQTAAETVQVPVKAAEDEQKS